MSPYPQLKIPIKINSSSNKTHAHHGQEGQQEQEEGRQKHFLGLSYSILSPDSSLSLFNNLCDGAFPYMADAVVIALTSTELSPCVPKTPGVFWPSFVEVTTTAEAF